MVSPEIQEWVKEVARFQNRAKNTFGARVTNFDLMSYMKQFPGLMNTYEGRKRINRMLEINYGMDELYEKALDQIYKKYGLEGIPQEAADDLAQKMIKDDTERLYNEYLGIDVQNQRQHDQEMGRSSQENKGVIMMRTPDGIEIPVPANEVEEAEKLGAMRI